ncbi:MAG: SPOR domain-containing protein [Burkholderiaceae bacterium]|nr:SPOR domain-containing protein [Burkholderiaceae bacterium]MCD8537974.1 SPOR domain-containing protein [Burkholderiaceae bacterium]MCD8564114.1 SPOR domain-containing protein [Burkholderiaceae bacterium]
MAKQKRTSKGGAFYGLIAGLLIGLSAAAAVAYFVMNSPMPFVDKASRSIADTELNPDRAPDPNQGLVPSAGTSSDNKDTLGELIATLPVDQGQAKPPLPAPPPAPKLQPSPTPVPAASPAAGANYYLQVGAFRVLEDAESLSARMLLLGLPVQIQRAEVNGIQVNRVRVGPYAKLDDMNAAREKLAAEKITANVVRQ